MDWKNQLTKTPYLILFIFLAAIGIGTASAVMIITIAGDVIIEGNTQIDNNLNVDGSITGNTINDLKQDLLDIQNSLSFMDIVVSNSGDDDISVLLRNGNGTFLPKIDTAVLDNPFGIAIGDLNNDGDQDVVVANRGTNENRISVLLRNGDGTFARTDIVTGEFPVWVEIDDINNDGNQDVVVSNGAANNTSVLLGKGDGTFLPKIDTDVGNDPRVLAIGDLNNDGNQDVVTANELSNDMSVLLGNGDGTFLPKTDFGVGEFPFGVAIGDIDNDGNQDVVVTSSFDGVDLVWANFGVGDGTFSGAIVPQFGSFSSPYGVAIGDINNDEYQDVVVSMRGDDIVSVLLGTADKSDFPSAVIDVNVGDSPFGVAIGDINNDGNQDIVVANNGINNNVSILLGDGAGGFAKTDVDVGNDPVGVAIGNLGGPTPLD